MKSVKDWTMRGLLALVPAIALAMPAFAQLVPTDPPGLADPSQPGSVLVYPLFVAGTVTVDGGPPAGYIAARTVIEVGAVCPAAFAPCADNLTMHVRGHWVCPGTAFVETPSVCNENDFTFTVTYGTSSAGKVTFNPGDNASPLPASVPGEYNGSIDVVTAPCARGYLILYAVNAFDQPIKFDGLIGDAIHRRANTDLESTEAIAIQADPRLGNLALIGGGLSATDPLDFDGQPGSYQMVTGQLQGDVAFDNDVAGPPFHDGHLILLTLDVHSGRSNNPTFVPLKFYNFFENEVSTQTLFTCWNQVQLSTLDSFLTVPGFGSLMLNGTLSTTGHAKGLVITGQAVDEITGDQVTLLGLFQNNEYAGSPLPPTSSPLLRTYTVRPGNNSNPIPTEFFP